MAELNLELRKTLLDVYSKCKESVMCINAYITDINNIFGKSMTVMVAESNTSEEFLTRVFNCGLTDKEKLKLMRLIS